MRVTPRVCFSQLPEKWKFKTGNHSGSLNATEREAVVNKFRGDDSESFGNYHNFPIQLCEESVGNRLTSEIERNF